MLGTITITSRRSSGGARWTRVVQSDSGAVPPSLGRGPLRGDGITCDVSSSMRLCTHSGSYEVRFAEHPPPHRAGVGDGGTMPFWSRSSSRSRRNSSRFGSIRFSRSSLSSSCFCPKRFSRSSLNSSCLGPNCSSRSCRSSSRFGPTCFSRSSCSSSRRCFSRSRVALTRCHSSLVALSSVAGSCA